MSIENNGNVDPNTPDKSKQQPSTPDSSMADAIGLVLILGVAGLFGSDLLAVPYARTQLIRQLHICRTLHDLEASVPGTLAAMGLVEKPAVSEPLPSPTPDVVPAPFTTPFDRACARAQTDLDTATHERFFERNMAAWRAILATRRGDSPNGMVQEACLTTDPAEVEACIKAAGAKAQHSDS